MGRPESVTRPMMTVMIAITMATMGRLMKNLYIRHSGRSLSRYKRLRVHRDAFLDLLNSLNHHAFPRLETFLNDPQRAGALANFNGPDMGLVVTAHDHDLVAALQLRYRALRDEQRAFPRVELHAHAGKLAGAKSIT